MNNVGYKTKVDKKINMSASHKENRLELIRENLKRGDKKHIAETTGVTPVWVSYVIMGKGVSERVLRAAEQLIAERKQTN